MMLQMENSTVAFWSQEFWTPLALPILPESFGGSSPAPTSIETGEGEVVHFETMAGSQYTWAYRVSLWDTGLAFPGPYSLLLFCMFLADMCLNEITKFGSWDHKPRRWLRKSKWEKGRVGPVSAKDDAKGSTGQQVTRFHLKGVMKT